MSRDDPRKPKTGPDRPTGATPSARMEDVRSVRLVRKYAEMIDGIHLEDAVVGDRLELSSRDADVLIAEGWAVPDTERPQRPPPRRAIASDRSRGPHKKPGH